MRISAHSPWTQVFGFSVLDHVPVGSCVLNSRMEVVFWNKVLENWTGIDRWEILHHSISEFYPHLSQPHYSNRLNDIFRGGPPLVLSSQLHGQIFPSTCPDGRPRLQHTTVTSIPTHDGSGCLACFAVEDVSEETRRIADLKATRDKAQNLAAEARRANAAKSQFLANMSHELRTPLNSILLLSGILQEDRPEKLSDADRNSVQIIERSGQVLLEMVNDILDFSKAEAGKRELNPEPLVLADFLRDIEGSTGLLISHNNLDFRVEVDQGVPETIVTDHQALFQITRNLLANAAKFTPEGEVVLHLSMECPEAQTAEDSRENWLALAVRDTGPGIAPERQEVIFEPFCQEDGTINREYGGTGLGLSISRQLAELMGGRLLLNSQPGQGSTFTLYLPTTTGAGAPVGTIPASRPRARDLDTGGQQWGVNRRAAEPAVTDGHVLDLWAGDHLADRRILVVVDDMRILYTLTGILGSAGAQTLTATSGAEGLLKVRQNPDLDLVILDLKTPEDTGRGLLDQLRSVPKGQGLPVICLAGRQRQANCGDCAGCPADGRLEQPFGQEDLIQTIENFLPQPAGAS